VGHAGRPACGRGHRGLALTLAGLGGDPYAVTVADVAAGVAIASQLLDAVAASVIDPPQRFTAWFGPPHA